VVPDAEPLSPAAAVRPLSSEAALSPDDEEWRPFAPLRPGGSFSLDDATPDAAAASSNAIIGFAARQTGHQEYKVTRICSSLESAPGECCLVPAHLIG